MTQPIKVETDAAMEDVFIVNKKGVDTNWTAHVAKIIQPLHRDKDQGNIRLFDIKLQFKDDYLTLYAKKGYYDENKGSIYLTDNINAELKDVHVIASAVDWNNESQTFCTKGDGVKIIGKRYVITGDKLCSLPNNRIRIDGNVKADFFM